MKLRFPTTAASRPAASNALKRSNFNPKLKGKSQPKK
jgi:hypothetical protein